MTCRQFEQRIQYVLDERRDLESDPLLLRHAQRCEHCRVLLSQYTQLCRVMSAELDDGGSCDVRDAVCDALREAGTLRPPCRIALPRGFVRALAYAAAVLFVVVVLERGYRALPTPQLPSSRPSTVSPEPVTVIAEIADSSRVVDERSAAGAIGPKDGSVVDREEASSLTVQPLDRHSDDERGHRDHQSRMVMSTGSILPYDLLESVLGVPTFDRSAQHAPARELSPQSFHQTLEPLANWIEQAVSAITQRLLLGRDGPSREPQAGLPVPWVVG